MTNQYQGYRGKAYHCLSIDRDEWLDDALLLFAPGDGKIVYFGTFQDCPSDFVRNVSIHMLTESQLIIPGLIDLHVHLPQLMVTGCQAPTLLDWLKTYIFAEEERFADKNYAEAISQLFFQSLLKNGTTTAAVFLTSHTEATDIAFQTALKTGNRVIMGLNLMDEWDNHHHLSRPTADLLADAEALCQKWHGQDQHRLQYAWMPRFALTSTPQLLERLGELRQKYPETYFHTHLSEQPSEIQATLNAFPEALDYTDVYARHQLLGQRSILAHGIHLSDSEQQVLKDKECVIAHCPGSNFFLKSGRFPLRTVIEKNIHAGLGSDVGAGPELSIFTAMRDAQYTQENWLVPLNTLFYLATLGAAKGLMMEAVVGNFQPHKQADFLVLDLEDLASLKHQQDGLQKQETLSRLIYQDGKHFIRQTIVQGQCVFDRDKQLACL